MDSFKLFSMTAKSFQMRTHFNATHYNRDKYYGDVTNINQQKYHKFDKNRKQRKLKRYLATMSRQNQKIKSSKNSNMMASKSSLFFHDRTYQSSFEDGNNKWKNSGRNILPKLYY